MAQIGKRGFILNDDSLIAGWREEFAANQCLVLHNLIEKSLSEQIIERLRTAEFYSNKHFSSEQQEFASDLTIRENELAVHQIHLLLNNPKLFTLLRQITDCPQIKCFSGRIYRNLPNTNHHLEWHDDLEVKERLIGISINLSAEKYLGGFFQIRKKKSKEILGQIESQNAGDAHIFRISPELQHRVTPTNGLSTRTAAAGWFMSEPDASEIIRSLYAAQ